MTDGQTAKQNDGQTAKNIPKIIYIQQFITSLHKRHIQKEESHLLPLVPEVRLLVKSSAAQRSLKLRVLKYAFGLLS
jgi:hypothetical protein